MKSKKTKKAKAATVVDMTPASEPRLLPDDAVAFTRADMERLYKAYSLVDSLNEILEAVCDHPMAGNIQNVLEPGADLLYELQDGIRSRFTSLPREGGES